MTRIGLLGDTHGNYRWTRFALWKFAKMGYTKVIQVGDFGIYRTNPGLSFISKVNKVAKALGIELYVVPGNHEDWNWIEQMTPTRTQWFNLYDKSNIFLAPRGLRWDWEGVSFVALGGAPSVDRAWRVRDQAGILSPTYHFWHAGEAITQEDVDYVVAGGYADVMVGHDAPMNVPTIESRIAGNPIGFDPVDLVYAADGRRMYNEAFRGVNPQIVLHGHYHFPVNDMIPNAAGGWTNVVGLHCDGSPKSLGHLDLATKKAYIWDVTEDIEAYNKVADSLTFS